MKGSDEAFSMEFMPQWELAISSTKMTILNLPSGSWDRFWKQPFEAGWARFAGHMGQDQLPGQHHEFANSRTRINLYSCLLTTGQFGSKLAMNRTTR